MLPLGAIGLARVADNQLVRQTEQALLAESVVVGELYRSLVEPSARMPLPSPPNGEPYLPFAPVLDLTEAPVLAPVRRGEIVRTSSGTLAMTAMLARVLVRNLSGIRVLDAGGVVVASATGTVGYSLAHLEEVQAALRGEYAPAVRARDRAGADAPLSSISRASQLRVSVAVPIYRDPWAPAGGGGRVIGVVYDNRTPLDVLKYIWMFRQELYVPAAVSVLLVLALVFGLGLVIARPLGRLEAAAEQVASGRDASLAVVGPAPREIHELAQSLGRMRAQLEARTAYVQQFATDTAHELKAPLTSLRGAAELLIDGAQTMPPDQMRRFLDNVHDDAVRMDGLVQRILHLARIEASTPKREAIDLPVFLAGIVERYARRDHHLELTVSTADPIVQMDPGQLDTLITNLVDNALRHGPDAPIELRVVDRHIEVIDKGPPQPPGHLDRIFERFYTTERDRGGSGLGLAIVRAVADAHGATVSAERREEGTVFIVELA